MKLSKKFQEFIYSISTNDKYSEFDSRKSFNRVNKPESEMNLLYSHHNQSVSGFGGGSFAGDTDAYNQTYNTAQSVQGVHEVRLAWRHIKSWLTRYSPDLNSSLSSPCTSSDLAEFQKDLNVKLPQCLLEFFQLTDGQSNFNENGSGGLIFGLKLMSVDEIVVMTENWRKVAKTLNHELSQIKSNNKLQELKKLQLSHSTITPAAVPNNNNSNNKQNSPPTPSSPNLSHPYSPSASSTSSLDLGHQHNTHDSNPSTNLLIRDSTDSLSSSLASSSYPRPSSSSAPTSSVKSPPVPHQLSIPPGTIHPTYAHPMWIPIITDEVGNCIGIDLSPPSSGGGKWGQVILFGREFDTKYLIADNFGDFLLIFANDLEMGNWQIKNWGNNNVDDNEDLMVGSEGELVFINNNDVTTTEKRRGNGEEMSYLEALKNRCIKKWLHSLTDSDRELEDNRRVLAELKSQPNNLTNLSPIQLNSIDSFINNNLNNIDNLNVKEGSGPQRRGSNFASASPLGSASSSNTPGSQASIIKKSNLPSVRSPLSHEITKNGNLESNLLDNIVEDDSDDDHHHDDDDFIARKNSYKKAGYHEVSL